MFPLLKPVCLDASCAEIKVFIISFVISEAVQLFGYNWPFLISLQSILIASAVSVSIGIIFGIYPANKASKISPMEALRYE